MFTQLEQSLRTIGSVVQSPSFKVESNAFFAKYSGVFEYEEENKLEYTPIHTQYVEMVEALIAEGLKGKNVSIDQVMEDLPEYVKNGEPDDQIVETMEFLTSCTDFLAFKDLMLSKKDTQEPTVVAESTENAVAACAAADLLLLQAAELATSEGWTVILNNPGFKVERSVVNKGATTEDTFRSHLEIGLNCQQAVDMFTDYSDNRTKYKSGVKNCCTLKVFHPDDRLVKATFELPALVRMFGISSEYTLRVTVKRDYPDKGCYTCMTVEWNQATDMPVANAKINERSIVRPHPVEPDTKSVIVAVSTSPSKWLPNWLLGVVLKGATTTHMNQLVNSYKAFKNIA